MFERLTRLLDPFPEDVPLVDFVLLGVAVLLELLDHRSVVKVAFAFRKGEGIVDLDGFFACDTQKKGTFRTLRARLLVGGFGRRQEQVEFLFEQLPVPTDVPCET